MEDDMKSQMVQILEGVDYISALPDDLVESILLKLPLRDAARTCILSTRWRDSWVKLPVLDLNPQFFKSLQGESQIGRRAKFAMIISQILALHQGPITEFRLKNLQLEGFPEVDSLIKFLSGKEIKTFNLHISSGVKYKLPSSIFTCQSLDELALFNCEIPLLPSTFRGFSRLERLYLYDVIISSQQLRYIVSNCPSLKKLRLEVPVDILCLGINSPSLGNLLVCKHRQTTNFVQQKNSMSLTSDAFGALPNLHTLRLDSASLQSLFAGGVPTRLLTLSAYLKLKELGLFLIDPERVDHFSYVLCLLRSLPDLQKIEIVHFQGNRCEIRNIKLSTNIQVVEDYSNYNLNKLKEVSINNVLGGSSEMELIKLLLAKSPSLEKLTIKLLTSRLADNGRNFKKEMLMFQGASSKLKFCIIHCLCC